METNPYRALTQIQDLRHLFCGEFLHIVKNEYDPQLRWDVENSLLQQIAALRKKNGAFRRYCRIAKKLIELRFLWHQIIK